MKTLHPEIQKLKVQTAGEYLTSRYASQPDFKVHVAEGDGRVIEGYLAVFNVPEDFGKGVTTTTVKGCFAKSLNERGAQSNAKDKIIHLWMHDNKEPIGQYQELYEDDYGLRFKLLVDDTQGRPEQVLRQTRSGTLNQYSYGFEYVWDKMEYSESKKTVLMMECRLFEGSSVTIRPANRETFTIRSEEDVQTILSELGMDAEELIDRAPRQLRMELKQLVTRYKSLAEFKPSLESKILSSLKPIDDVVISVGGYRLKF